MSNVMKEKAKIYVATWNEFRLENIKNTFYRQSDISDSARRFGCKYYNLMVRTLIDKGRIRVVDNDLGENQFSFTDSPIHYSVMAEVMDTTKRSIPSGESVKLSDKELVAELRARGYEVTAIKSI